MRSRDKVGTVAELTTRVKAHIEAHPELADNARFAGLFQRNRWMRAEDNSVPVLATSSTHADHPPSAVQ